jgi:hypothetical protein
LDYKAIHEIVENNLFTLIQKPESPKLLEEFSNQKPKSLFQDLKKLNKSEQTHLNRLNTLSIVYAIGKGDFENSSLSNNLPEICVEEECTYRSMLINFLMMLSTNIETQDFIKVINF